MTDIFLLRRSRFDGGYKDDELELRLREAGHDVATGRDALPDEVFNSLIIITDATIDPSWADDPRPILCCSDRAAKTLGMTSVSDGPRATDSLNESLAVPPDPTHPIVQGYPEGLYVHGAHEGFTSGYGSGEPVLSIGDVHIVIAYEAGAARVDGGIFPARRCFHYAGDVYWFSSGDAIAYNDYQAPVRDVLENAIAWLLAGYTPPEQNIDPARLNLLLRLDETNIPRFKREAIKTFCEAIAVDTLDDAMYQVMKAAAQTERYNNASLPREERLNRYRWRMDLNATRPAFRGYCYLPTSGSD